ncbi:winged helix-turn-helix DNA-binding protein [Brevundimonas phage vB_BpoS-Domovoi]|uniref:Winged helix-turn-helix DNA-binding protein n=1 Tax=Brevundimonas phage vB_BpoS-Domovoi TaxID=2948598 RepID=A0A9E7SK41_9CAUD|nr:winged helix-turn-helix DNA-binding protein [Brevundimonas phage vB_BpoS-Domovoi]
MFKNIGYHTRLKSDNTVKAAGGSFGGDFGQETAERLVKAQFTVKVRPSGSLTFVDRQGREVSLYMTIDPETTEAGKAALAEHRRAQAAAQAVEDDKARQVQDLMDTMTNDEIIARLSAPSR